MSVNKTPRRHCEQREAIHTDFHKTGWPRRLCRLAMTICLLLALPAHAAVVEARMVAASPPDKASAMGFKGHKALYNIKLASTHSGSQVVNIAGQMLYEAQPACEAWISNHSFNVTYEYADTAPLRVMSDFSTYEPFDGKSLNFTSQRKRDGELFEELRGQATLGADKDGKALFTLPEGLDFDLPQGTLFPLQHSLSILEHIRNGQKFFKSTIFDGSDEEGPAEVTAFIGKPVTPVVNPKDRAAIDKTLLSSPAHKVRLAFFSLKSPEAAPDYQMTLTFHDNGVISDMMIEYDDFTLSQTLVALEPLGAACGQNTNLNE